MKTYNKILLSGLLVLCVCPILRAADPYLLLSREQQATLDYKLEQHHQTMEQQIRQQTKQITSEVVAEVTTEMHRRIDKQIEETNTSMEKINSLLEKTDTSIKKLNTLLKPELDQDEILDKVNTEFFSKERTSNAQKKAKCKKTKYISPERRYMLPSWYSPLETFTHYLAQLPWPTWQQAIEDPCSQKEAEKLQLELLTKISQRRTARRSPWKLKVRPHILETMTPNDEAWVERQKDHFTGRDLRQLELYRSK